MRLLLFLLVLAVCEEYEPDDLKIVLIHAKDQMTRIEFCTRCADPATEGSFALGLNAIQGVQQYQVSSDLVYAVPNDAKTVMNEVEARGRVVMCDRGNEIPLVRKVLAVQAAGALGVVIVDDGQCSHELDCGRAGSVRMGGFAPKDDPQAWRQVVIPAVLVSGDSGSRLRNLMPLDRRNLPDMGFQFLAKKKTASQSHLTRSRNQRRSRRKKIEL